MLYRFFPARFRRSEVVIDPIIDDSPSTDPDVSIDDLEITLDHDQLPIDYFVPDQIDPLDLMRRDMLIDLYAAMVVVTARIVGGDNYDFEEWRNTGSYLDSSQLRRLIRSYDDILKT